MPSFECRCSVHQQIELRMSQRLIETITEYVKIKHRDIFDDLEGAMSKGDIINVYRNQRKLVNIIHYREIT